MALSDPSLAELARLYGIAEEFWDWKGRQTVVSDETVIAVLASRDVTAPTPEKSAHAVGEYHKRAWQRMLPPVVVMEEGQTTHVNVHVSAGDWAHLTIRLEDGGVWDAHQVENWEPDRDIDGVWTGEATFRLPDGLPLGYHRLHIAPGGREAETVLIVTPNWLGFPAAMGTKRIWGYATQLYSVRSKDSWEVGDLTDLADLATWSATQQFANYVLINPLHAAEPVPPLEPSPYLPTSRRYVNPIYIRPEAIEEYGLLTDEQRHEIEQFRADLLAATQGNRGIDRDAAWAAKMAALRIVFTAGVRPARQMAFDSFRRSEGRPLAQFATWCALVETYGIGWRYWPEELQRPSSPEVREFAREHVDQVQFYEWLQWIAETQLSTAQQAAKDAGMSVGIISDLAVGVSREGADAWALTDVFAQGMTVGAPPDPFNQLGQDWSQPPWRPDRLADLAYAPYRTMVAGILRHSGGVRIDHIIGLFRLWWVPEGKTAKEGTYVRYDHDALIGIIALEAKRAGALVIGEDLGTVEPWVREYLRRRGILGTSILWFEADEQGNPMPNERWREYCMASVTTHDLPPTAGYLAGDHVRLRHSLGLLTESLEDELAFDKAEHEAWLTKLRDVGALAPGEEDVEQIVLAMHRYITWTPSRVLCTALTDAVGDRLTQNQPGTIDEYPNWRVPLSHPDGSPMYLEEVFTDPRPTRLSAVMNGFANVPDTWAPPTKREAGDL